ncbi:MAG: UDP-N-acetylglucosamine 2-epimerase, partial [Verrucomicrobiota bacterium]
AHIHGGEVSEGAIDEVFRHAITKMSHLHFPATEEYAQRIIQMGEHPERVFTCGAPGLDNLNQITRMSARELEEDLGVSLDGDVILVTYHPVTRELGQTSEQFNQCLLVLKETETTVIFTYPNADPSGRVIIEMINQFVESQDRAFAFENLGTKRYFSLMSQATVMLGNSSSGIIEAASFGLPVLNIGNRQRGRSKGRNVVDVAPQQEEMGKALSKVLSREFRQSLDGMENIYGDGHAAAKIATVLSEWKLDSAGAMKSFFEG